MSGQVRIGTSGWQYRDWRGPVYPQSMPQRRWLEHYASLFATVELNNSFYRLPTHDLFTRWGATTPDDFCFAVKASRYLTHVRRLREPADAVRLLLDRAAGLGAKLGPILVQLPPHFPCDVGRLDATLAAFGPAHRVCVEVRDDRWHDDRVYEVLSSHGAALVWWDRRGRRGTTVRTADWCFLRLHEGTASPPPSYGRRALESWCTRLEEAFGADPDAWVFFNNDPGAAAPRDATAFARLAAAHGMNTTRAPRDARTLASML
jgi:uncharacterized protein YecE (DUF72 family)